MSASIPPPGDRFDPVTAEIAFVASPLPQALLDGSWRVVRANPAWIAISGADPAGISWMELVHPEDLARDLPAIGRMQSGGGAAPLRTALRLRLAGGGWTDVDLHATPLGSEGALATLLPAAAERAGMAPSASGISRDRQVLASALSHDVRQHARLAGAYASLLDRSQLTDRQRAQVATISDHADRLQQILGDLVRWLRLADEPIERGPCDLAAIWGAALAGVEAESSCGELPVVSGDPVLLTTLLSELVRNAVRYRGGIPRLRLEARLRKGMWELIVSDDGPGIPELQREQVLRPLHRLHSWEQVPGHGMGLALAERIAERHGGSLRIAGATGGGCAVHVLLPA